MNNPQFTIPDHVIAEKSQRFANYIIDLIVQYILLFIIFVLMLYIAGLFGNTGVQQWMGSINQIQGYLIGCLMVFLYYYVMESTLRRTVGKYITGTLVVFEDGTTPNNDDILKRTLCRLIPFEIFSFLGERGWHDSIPHTYVVKKEAFEEVYNLFHSVDEIGQKDDEK